MYYIRQTKGLNVLLNWFDNFDDFDRSPGGVCFTRPTRRPRAPNGTFWCQPDNLHVRFQLPLKFGYHYDEKLKPKNVAI